MDDQEAKSPSVISRSEAKSKGLTLYYTGAPCANGHVDQRWTVSARCKTCQSASSKKYAAENKDKVKERQKARNKLASPNIREKRLASNKAWREANKEKNAERMAKWQSQNKGHIREYNKKYRKTAIWKVINHTANTMKRCIRGGYTDDRSTKKLGYTPTQLKAHIERQFLPGMDWSNYGDWEIDHITPVRQFFSEGVTDPRVISALPNLRPAWKSENRAKGGKRIQLL